MIYPVETKFEMFDLFEMTPDLVCIAGKDGYFRKVNPAVISKLGYTAEELFSRPISSFIHPDDAEYTGSERNKLLQGKTLLNFRNRYITKAGKVVWLEWTSVYLPEKAIVFAIAKDITESKRKEKEIEEMYAKYKSLATHFKSRIEEDRKYLAYELHEELAQLAAVIKMDISWIDQHLTNMPAEVKERTENALILSDLLIRTIRRVSFSISPNMLDDLGFNTTLEWQCKEFSILNGIPCYFTSNCDNIVLSKEEQIDFFRICQEALGNIMEHAEAKSVKIAVRADKETVTLSIADDGQGFDVGELKPSAGIQHMQQLAASISGRLTIQSETGKGTMVIVVIRRAWNDLLSDHDR